jgi:hypothetical protein
MNYLSSFKQLSRAKQVGVLLIATTLTSVIGLPAFFSTASAAQLTFVSDTASSSAPSAATNHYIAWTAPNAITFPATTTIQYDPSGLAFTFGQLGTSDLTVTGMTLVADLASCTGPTTNEVYLYATTSDTITLAVCGLNGIDTVSSGAKTVNIGGSKITNPSGTGSYVVRIYNGATDFADTRVAIISAVTVTAVVDTSLTFTINAILPGVSVNGTTTNATSTATTITFGTTTPGIPKIAAQDLRVTTNAKNGFQVTVIQNGNLLSSNGADIDLFLANNGTGTPSSWQAPANTITDENTWGHYGLMTDDADLGSGVPTFGSNQWVGNFGTTSRLVFYHGTSSDGVTQNIGKTTVAYALQVGPLQEAATDYTNTLTYVCTPTF